MKEISEIYLEVFKWNITTNRIQWTQCIRGANGHDVRSIVASSTQIFSAIIRNNNNN